MVAIVWECVVVFNQLFGCFSTSPTVEASATSELVRKENIRGHHKRYSSAASSADGEYTTEADTETSGPEEHTDNNLKDTTTSTVHPHVTLPPTKCIRNKWRSSFFLYQYSSTHFLAFH